MDNKGYIEVTEKYEHVKVIVPLSIIMSISQQKDLTAFIETGYDAKGVSTGVFTCDLYVEVKNKLMQLRQVV